MEQFYYASDKSGLDAGQLQEALKESISGILNQREACPGTGLKKVLIVGPDFRKLMPASISIGICYLIVIDDLCRTLTSMEIPIGVITGIIGIPLFVYSSSGLTIIEISLSS